MKIRLESFYFGLLEQWINPSKLIIDDGYLHLIYVHLRKYNQEAHKGVTSARHIRSYYHALSCEFKLRAVL